MNVINPNKCFSDILKYYIDVMNISVDDYANKKRRLKLPIIPEPILSCLLESVSNIFKEETILLNISSPCIIVGDVHGQLLDLFRILKSFPLPPATKYIFLGDLVDRGEFSTETVTLTFILKVLYPQNIFIIRGNHEFGEISQRSDFFAELFSIYSNSSPLPQAFENAFSYMPLAAIIDNESILIHGGIGPSINDIESITSIQRPVLNFKNEKVADLLWSDPSDTISMFIPSNRGTGSIFGPNSLNSFLSNSNLKVLIRGHQCVENGCQTEISGKVITVFSASNYCGITNNKAGVLIINQSTPLLKQSTIQKPNFILQNSIDNNSKISNISLKENLSNSYHTKIFDPLPKFSRSDVVFVKSESEYALSIPQHSVSSIFGKNNENRASKVPHRRLSTNPICSKISLCPNSNAISLSDPTNNQTNAHSKQTLNVSRNKIPQCSPLQPPSYSKSLSANSVLENRPNPRRKSSQIAHTLAQRISI